MAFSILKNEKLKSKKQIERLFVDGKSISNYPLKLIYQKVDSLGENDSKVAFIVPKKNFGGAVHRNRIKRLLREGYRLNKHLIFNNIEGKFTFAIIYIGKDMPNYQMIKENIQGLFNKFIKKTTHEKME
ncbi:MAG: ribonuclease P protein component [Croceitalea sp.]|nr:ribonuclease P protein component [Croceitalea sp.]